MSVVPVERCSPDRAKWRSMSQATAQAQGGAGVFIIVAMLFEVPRVILCSCHASQVIW